MGIRREITRRVILGSAPFFFWFFFSLLTTANFVNNCGGSPFLLSGFQLGYFPALRQLLYRHTRRGQDHRHSGNNEGNTRPSCHVNCDDSRECK